MNKAVHLDELPYRADSCELFERIRPLTGAALLDSSYPHASSGRYDILAADPIDAGLPTLPAEAGEAECRGFFEQLGDFHRCHYEGIKPAAQEIPFCGGILGFFSYDCGNSLNGITRRGIARRGDARHPKVLPGGELPPAVHLHAYDWCVIQDHLLQRAVLVAQPGVPAARRNDLLARLRGPLADRRGPFHLSEPFSSNFTAREYRTAFERIQAYIQAGDCYQVNLAQRFSAACEGDPWQAYRQLRVAAAAPFSAYLDLADRGAAICLSPERFISLHGYHVETSPIKGTRPRQGDAVADRLAALELHASEKDRAENLMIVDLLRNDLGRSCVPGSIHVDRLFEVQSFATVHHLVSTISGELQPDRGFAELLRDSFPGGSITGAPKRRAMEIIAELEPDPRRLYCGAVLYISADGRMDSNIAIRSLLCERSQIHCWAGGGIVADSQWQQEYQETYDKVGKFLTLLEAL
jgi:para-aminobenzoate synthetase component 1